MTRLADKRWFKVLNGDGIAFNRDFTGQILEYLCDDPDVPDYIVLMQPGYDCNGQECNVTRNRHCCVTFDSKSIEEVFDTDHLRPEETYVRDVAYVIAEHKGILHLNAGRYYHTVTSEYVDDIDKATVYSFDEIMSMRMPANGFPYPKESLEAYTARINAGRERMRQIEETEKAHFKAMYNRDSFKWQWEPTGPPHPGVWAYGGSKENPDSWTFAVSLHVPNHDSGDAGWYYYIGPWPIFEEHNEPVSKA